jgi:REP-associated tyrosine transposase
MANTYSQLHIQLIFAVKYRAAMIQKEWKERLHQYITGIIQNNEHKGLQINSMPDHTHIFIGMRPNQSIFSIGTKCKSRKYKVDQRK